MSILKTIIQLSLLLYYIKAQNTSNLNNKKEELNTQIDTLNNKISDIVESKEKDIKQNYEKSREKILNISQKITAIIIEDLKVQYKKTNYDSNIKEQLEIIVSEKNENRASLMKDRFSQSFKTEVKNKLENEYFGLLKKMYTEFPDIAKFITINEMVDNIITEFLKYYLEFYEKFKKYSEAATQILFILNGRCKPQNNLEEILCKKSFIEYFNDKLQLYKGSIKYDQHIKEQEFKEIITNEYKYNYIKELAKNQNNNDQFNLALKKVKDIENKILAEQEKLKIYNN